MKLGQNTIQPRNTKRNIWQTMHVDLKLFCALILLMVVGLFILYSAGNQSFALLERQTIRLFIAFCVMMVFAFTPPSKYRLWAPYLYTAGIFLLLVVLIVGHIGKGAQRWLDLGFFRFQPSEILKLALPMMLAWYLSDGHIPPRRKNASLYFAYDSSSCFAYCKTT